jgi:hypothetical protein
MRNLSSPVSVRQFSLAAALALASVLLAARPAAAQIWISPDRSIVDFGRQPQFLVRGSWPVTPIVIPPNNSYVRIGGNFSFTVVDTTATYPMAGFIKPFYTTDRARAANFYGAPNYNPFPVVTGRFQKWW